MKQKTSKYRGVYWYKSNKKWIAAINSPLGRTRLGAFNKEEDARDAFLAEEKKIYGRNFDKLIPILDDEKQIVKIPLSCGKGAQCIKNYGKYWAIIDINDFDKIKNYNFHLLKGKYAGTIMGNKNTSMHRILLNVKNNEVIDHINGDGLDNRRCNLRIVSNKQNSWNTKKTKRKCTSKYKGVFFNKKMNKWVVVVKLSIYNNEIDAAKVRDNIVRKIHGKHGRYNFPKKGEQSALYEKEANG